MERPKILILQIMVMHRGSAVLLHGKDNLVSSGGDKASLNFMELGHVDGNGMVKANGPYFMMRMREANSHILVILYPYIQMR
jgi:hypothetical protein